MPTGQDLVESARAALAILDALIAQAQASQDAAVGNDVDKWDQVLTPLQNERSKLAAAIIQVDMTAPAMQEAIDGLSNQANRLTSIAAQMTDVTKSLNKLADALDATGKIIGMLGH